MSITPEIRAELLELVRAARAYVELEQVWGSPGLSLPVRPVQASPAGPSAARGIASGELRPPPGQGPVPSASVNPGQPATQPSASTPPPAAIGGADRLHRLELLAREAAECTGCVLHEKRQKSVFARGSAEAELVFVGEGPGRDEDREGYPFVGAAGKLLDRMIAAMGYGRDDVYICNVVKCRPPENRTPRPEEALACSRFLIPQLETVSPKLIVALGRCAAQALGVAEAMGSWRGRFGAWRGIPVMPTYHPAFLLRSPEFKRVVWDDLQLVMGRLGRTPARSQT